MPSGRQPKFVLPFWLRWPTQFGSIWRKHHLRRPFSWVIVRVTCVWIDSGLGGRGVARGEGGVVAQVKRGTFGFRDNIGSEYPVALRIVCEDRQ